MFMTRLAKHFIVCSLLVSVLCLAVPASAQTPASDAPAAAAITAGDRESDFEARLAKIEDQIVDLQAQSATLESLARGATAGAAAGFPAGAENAPPAGDDGGRIAGIEVQLQALTAQMADILQRLQQMEAAQGIPPRRSGDAGGPAQRGADVARGPADSLPPLVSRDVTAGNASGPGPVFGSAAIETRSDFESPVSGQRIAGGPQGLPPSFAQSPAPARGAQPARFSTSQSRALYDQAYSSLVKREYQAAETYFTQFLQLHPDDALAGPAMFWLGETSFVSGEYRKAADRFLKAYTTFPDDDKAPEALLKLGISLKRLGENGAACDTFSELIQKFPQAQAIVQRAEAEKRRTRC